VEEVADKRAGVFAQGQFQGPLGPGKEVAIGVHAEAAQVVVRHEIDEGVPAEELFQDFKAVAVGGQLGVALPEVLLLLESFFQSVDLLAEASQLLVELAELVAQLLPLGADALVFGGVVLVGFLLDFCAAVLQFLQAGEEFVDAAPFLGDVNAALEEALCLFWRELFGVAAGVEVLLSLEPLGFQFVYLCCKGLKLGLEGIVVLLLLAVLLLQLGEGGLQGLQAVFEALESLLELFGGKIPEVVREALVQEVALSAEGIVLGCLLFGGLAGLVFAGFDVHELLVELVGGSAAALELIAEFGTAALGGVELFGGIVGGPAFPVEGGAVVC